MNPASATFPPRRLLAALFLTMVALGTIVLGAAYAGSDGGHWIQAYPARLGSSQTLLFQIGKIGVLAGAAIALLTGSRRRLPFVCGTVAAIGAIVVGMSGSLPAKLAVWLDLPDWARITLLLIAGAAWGLGWGVARAAARARPPLWSLIGPFILAGAAVPVLSGSIGGGVTLAWLLIFAPALGQAAWDHFPSPVSASRAAIFIPPVVAFALGVALLGSLAFVLGLAHLAYRTELVGALALLTLLLWHRAGARLCAAVRELSAPAQLSPPGAILMGTLGAILLAQWIASLGPEIGGDSIGGRVALPVMWMRHGVISARPEIVLSYMSLGGESLFLLFLPLAGYSVAKIVAFGCTLVVSGTVMGRGFRWNKSWAIAAAIVFAGSTVVWWQYIWGFCDLLQVLLMLGAAESLRRWLQRDDRRALVAAGLLAGAATAVKLNGVVAVAAAIGLAFAATLWRRRSWRAAAGAALWTGVPAALILGLPFLRSFVLTGNPVFPFANTLFKSPLAPEAVVRSNFGFPVGTGAWQVIYRIFLEPGRFVELGTYHPFILPLLAGSAAALGAAKSVGRYWAAAFLLSAAFWMLTEQNLRYSFYVGLFGVIAIARVTTGLRPNRGLLAWTLPSLLMAAIVLGGVMLELARPSFWMSAGTDSASFPLRWALRQETTDTFLRANHSTYALGQILNREVGEKARVWEMPWSRDHLYFEATMVSMPHGDIRMLAPLDALLPDRGPVLPPAGIAAALRKAGITHLIMETDNPWEGNSPESEWTGIYSPAFTQAWLDPVAANQSLRLYRLRALSVPRPVPGALVGSMPLVSGSRGFPVKGDSLYEIVLRPMPATSTANESITLAWYDAAGKLLSFQPKSLPQGMPKGWHRWLQSAPPAASTLTVFLSAAHPDSAIEVRALPP